MTRGFVADCAGWADRLGRAVESAGEALLEDEQVHRLGMASGHQIVGMSSSPRGWRGKGRPGDVAIIDEAAFVDDLREVLQAALSTRMWGGRVRVLSTHRGESSPFNELVRDVRGGAIPGSLHRVTLRDALADGLHRRICEVAGRPWSPEAEAAWEAELRAQLGAAASEELDCVPGSAAGAWLPWELIRAAEDDDAGRPEQRGGGPAYVGVDVARRRDLWVAVAVERAGGRMWVRELATLRDAPFSRQAETLARLVAAHRPVRVAIDQTGMGEAVVEHAQEAHGRHRVEGVLLTAPRRLDVATALRESLEDGRLRIPPSQALRDDLHAVRVEEGPTGAPRLVADRAGTDGHADRFWALALAVAASAEAPRRYEYLPGMAGHRERTRDWRRDGFGDDDIPLGRWDAYAPGGVGRLGAGRGLP